MVVIERALECIPPPMDIGAVPPKDGRGGSIPLGGSKLSLRGETGDHLTLRTLGCRFESCRRDQ